MENALKIKKDYFWIFLSVITCLTSTPYITHYLFGGAYTVLSAFLSITIFVVTLKYYRSYNWTNILWVFAFAFAFYGVLMLFIFQNTGDIRKAIGILIKILYVIGSSFLIRKHYSKYIYTFFSVNNLIIVLSIVLFFVLLVIPYEPLTFIKQDGRPHFIYFPLGATNIKFSFAGFTFIRIAGIADEPGALALIISYLLVLNEMTLKSSSYRKLYIIGGSLTFSMAFFITIVPMIIYWVKEHIISVKWLIVVFVLFSCVILYIDKDTAVYQAMDKLVFERFTQNDEGRLSGDNRSDSVPKQIDAFNSSPILGIGYNEEKIEKYELGIPSFFSYLGTHGIFGYLFFYLPFIFLLVYKKKYRLPLLVIALNFLQRPSIEEMFSLISLTLIYYSDFYERKTSNINYHSHI